MSSPINSEVEYWSYAINFYTMHSYFQKIQTLNHAPIEHFIQFDWRSTQQKHKLSSNKHSPILAHQALCASEMYEVSLVASFPTPPPVTNSQYN